MPVNVDLDFSGGGTLTVDAGRTLVVHGVTSTCRPIFVGTGSTLFAKDVLRAPPIVFPEWWGAVRDGKSDDGPAINRALRGCPDSGTVFLSPGDYNIATPLIIPKSLTLRGSNMRGTRLVWAGQGGALLTVQDETSVDNVRLEEFGIDNIGVADIGIQLQGCRTVMSRIFSNARRRFDVALVRTRVDEATFHIIVRDCAFFVSKAGEETPIGFHAVGGHTMVVDASMFSGFLTAIRVGEGERHGVAGFSLTNSRVEAFSGTSPRYPGGGDSCVRTRRRERAKG